MNNHTEIKKIWEVVEYLKDAIEELNKEVDSEHVTNLLEIVDNILEE